MEDVAKSLADQRHRVVDAIARVHTSEMEHAADLKRLLDDEDRRQAFLFRKVSRTCSQPCASRPISAVFPSRGFAIRLLLPMIIPMFDFDSKRSKKLNSFLHVSFHSMHVVRSYSGEGGGAGHKNAARGRHKKVDLLLLTRSQTEG